MGHPARDDAFLSGGEMGALARELDWSASPLGPPAAWPQSLRTAVSLCLMSRFPMAVCWGPEYAIVYNDSYRHILGTKHPWAMGRPCFEVWSELAHIVQPMFDGVIQTGEATWSDDLMLPMLRHGYLEEAYFTVSYSAVRGESERPEGVLVTVTETTERYLAERRLRVVRALGDASGAARSVAQVSEDVRQILDAHRADVPFSILYSVDLEAGEARLTAATAVRAGDPVAHVRVPLREDARPWPFAGLLRDASARVVEGLEACGTLPGGIWPEPAVRAVLLPIPHPGRPEPLAVLAAGVNPRRALDAPHLEFFELVARQIANAMANAIAHEESRRRAEALAEIDRAKTAFFSNVSHEFRTPLTLMLGPLHDMLSGAGELGPEDRERVDVAYRNSVRLLKLVNTLLDFARIEAGRIQASYERTDVGAFTAELASGFRSAIERAGLRCVVDCAPTPGEVYVDREMWEKVVLNLLSNAFKFTFEGEIDVSLREKEGRVELTVRDTGTGIPADELPHLFERFHRVRNARSRSYEGTGIGLALVQELVKLHGGTVQVQSEPGRGSTFTVTIPTGMAHLPAERVGVPGSQASSRHGGAYLDEMLRWTPGPAAPRALEGRAEGRVLLVDDNADMREYVTRLLSSRGYDVEAVADGLQALEAMRVRRPDIVLSDVMMPALDGFELLTAIRSDPALREIPVVLLSARAGEEAWVEGLRAGADDYLVKPFGANELAARVAATVKLGRLRREGEERLEHANRELRRHVLEQEALLDVLPIGIGIASDRECRDIRINRAFAAMLGIGPDANASLTAPPDERPGNFRMRTPEGVDVPGEQLPMQVAAREGREVRGVQLDIVHDDGRVMRLLEYAAPLFDDRGEPRGAVGAFVDVTASHRAGLILARSEERYRRIFDTAGVSIWEEDFSEVVRAVDALRADGVDDLERYLLDHPDFVDRCLGLVKVVDVNRASLRMFGAPDKEALVASLSDVFAPDTRDVFRGEILALARGDRRFETESALRTLDGRRIHALISLTFPEPGHAFDSVLVSLADITDRKQAETALQQEVAIRTAIEQVGASLAGELNSERLVQAVTDAATNLTEAEFGAFFHNVRDEKGESYSLYSLSGAPREAFSRFPHPRATEVFGPTFRGEGIIRLDDVTRDPRYGRNPPYKGMPEGHLPVRSYLAVPVVARDGQVLGGLFFGHSRPAVFTARHEQLAAGVASWAAIALDNARLYRDLEQANRLKDEFLATLSHELRTPLNAVLGWAHMLREGALEPGMRQRALEAVERNARTQAQLVEDLLDVSRIMSGKLYIREDVVELGSVIANAVETVKAGVTAKGLDLRVHADDRRRIFVTGDADRLQQVVWNLVSNAIKFTPVGGRVDVDLRLDGQSAEISVRDTGEGIDPAFLPFLFERFRQMDGTMARRHGGLGLGLSIVRHLTEAHGGTVTAESAGEGAGATFVVRLPVRSVEDCAPLTIAAPEEGRGTLEGVRALVVDGEPDARELMRQALESRGARAVTASSAGEALHHLRHEAFDVMIADVTLPEQDGYALIRVVREFPDGRHRDVLSIAVTGRANAREAERALEAGYDRHLARPVDAGRLVALVSDAARAQRPAGAADE